MIAWQMASAYNTPMFVLLHGPDEFSAHEELSALKASLNVDYNVDTFSGADADLASIRAVCDTMPFLSAQRLVIVEGLPKRKRAGGDETDSPSAEVPRNEGSPASRGKGAKKSRASGSDPKAFINGLAEYAALVPEFTVLVVMTEEKLEDSHALVRVAAAPNKALQFTIPRGPELERWLVKRARKADVTMSREASAMLANGAGDSLRPLAMEVDKLATYVGPGGTIRPEDVRQLGTLSRQSTVFDLTDALLRRDRARALTLLHELLEAGEAPPGIIGLVAYQTRTLLQVKSLSEQGLNEFEIAQQAGIAPFAVKKSMPVARTLSHTQLEAAHRALRTVDVALKSSQMRPEVALDLMVVGFAAVTS